MTTGFIENGGQLGEEKIRYYTSDGPLNAAFTDEMVVFSVDAGISADAGSPTTCSFTLSLVGAKRVEPFGVDPYGHDSNFFIGQDADRWRSGIKTYHEVMYEDMLDGVDLRFRSEDGRIKYDIILKPGMDLSAVNLQYDGIEGLTVDPVSGDLLIRTKVGIVRDTSPIIDQGDGDGQFPGSFVLLGGGLFGFECDGPLDPALPTIIDPGLVFASYIGGSGDDHAAGSKVDGSGRIYVIGATLSPDFPVTPLAAETEWNLNQGNGYDGYVALFSADGSDLIGCTYMGGEADDVFSDLVILPSGELVITGWTVSRNFPTRNDSLYHSYNGGRRDACICRLSADLSDLYYGSFLGGSGYDGQTVIDIGPDNSIFITGITNSTDFPTTTDAFQRNIASLDGATDSFVVHLNWTLREVYYSTYVGGSGTDWPPECAVDPNGSLYVSLWTDSTDLVTTDGCYCDTFGGGEFDGYIYLLSANGTELLASTYFGGDGFDVIADVLVDRKGRVYLCGATTSKDFCSTLDAPYPNRFPNPDREDSFISIFNADLTRVEFSTFLGGDGWDIGYDLAMSDDEETLAFIGVTDTDSIDTTDGCYDDSLGGRDDLFICVLDLKSRNITYCTYFGGSLLDECTLPAGVLSFDTDGALCFAAETTSKDFPTTYGAFQREHQGGALDIAVVRLVPEACPIPAAPDVEMVWGDLFVNLSWNLTGFKCSRLKDVNVYRGLSPDQPDGPPRRLGPDITYFNDTAGLEYGETYYYWVSVVTAAGEGARDGPTAVTIIGKPIARLNLTARSGDGNVMIEWNGTIDWRGGTLLRELRVYRGLDEVGLAPIEENISGNDTWYLDDDPALTDGVEYLYAIQPYNERYLGNLENITVKVFSPPTAPRHLTGEPGDSVVTLDWDPPLNDGGEDIDGYRIDRKVEGGQFFTVADQPHQDTFYTDTDLINGTDYWYRVQAYNERVNGTFSRIILVKPFGHPSAPVNIAVDSELGNISIHWDPPTIHYDENISYYTVYWSEDPEHLEEWAYPLDTDWVSREHELNVTYYFRLSATNAQGEGPRTDLFQVSTLKPPGRPLNLSISNSTVSLFLEWDPPREDGGSSPLTYIIIRWTGSTSRQEIDTTMETHYEDWNLTGGETYHYRVKANNGRYSGPESVEDQYLFRRTPKGPEKITIEQGSDSIIVSWEPPEDDGGTNIDAYTVKREIVGVTGSSLNVGDGSTTFTDKNEITANTTYIYSVMARNSIGWGEYSEAMNITVIGNVSRPMDLTWSDEGGYLELRWLPPERQEFVKFRGYVIYKGTNVSTMEALSERCHQTKFKDKDVEFGIYYYYQVRMDTDIGLSPPSNDIIAVVKPVPPVPDDFGPILIMILLLLVLVLVIGSKLVTYRRRTLEDEGEGIPPVATTEPEIPVPPWATPSPTKKPKTVPAITDAPEGILPYIVEEVFVVYNDGRLITSCAREECGTADADLMSGMLIAIQGLIQDGLESGGTLEQIKYGENLISLATGDHVVLAAVVYGRPDDQLQEDLKATVTNIEGTYSGVIEEWTGEAAALVGLDDLVMPLIGKTVYLTRDDVGDVLADHGVALLSAIDFHRGYVRLKMAAVNATGDTIIDAAVEVHYDGDMLRLERVEPDTIVMRGDRTTLGNILPGERKTVALLFDPQICQSTHLDGHLSYYDSKGELRYVEMKRRTADVVCPIFFTRENANTAMLRRLMTETLHHSDLRIYRYPHGLSAREVLTVAKQALGSDEVQLVREYITETPAYEAEVWYYAETRVKGYQFVIRLGVVEDKGVVELFAASTAMEPITGLLADFRRELNRILAERYEEDAKMEVIRDEGLRRDLERRPLRLDASEDEEA